VLLKKVSRCRYIGDGKVDVIEFHSCLRLYILMLRNRRVRELVRRSPSCKRWAII
jgi:hypothetical protein